MLSRVADSIYWLSRYLERAENIARILDVNIQMTLDLPSSFQEQWAPLVQITAEDEFFAEHYGKPTQETVTCFLLFDKNYPNSILSCLRAARENARSIRDAITSEMWEQINDFYHLVNNASSVPHVLGSPHHLLDEIKQESHQFIGIVHALYSHGEGYHFSRLGRSIERADKTSRILDVKYFVILPSISHVGTPYDGIQWAAVLKSIGAFEMYRKKYGRILPERVVEFLLLDHEFPRSVRFCLGNAEQSLHAITGTPQGAYRNKAEQFLGQLSSELAYTSSSEIIESGLHEFLDSLQGKLNRLDEAICETFFALRPLGHIG